MASSLQYYSQLADRQTGQLTSGRENWTAFLDAAARLYKYPFPEQLMIFAQRPDAKACAPFETWRDTMKSYVRRGSKGIALIDDTGSEPRLKFVFDISDTGMVSKQNNRRPVLWEMKPEHEVPIMNALKNAYGDRDGDIKNLIYDIAAELAEDCYNNSADEIYSALEGSYLENVDAFMAGETFREALTISTAYSIMSRCGLSPSDYFEDEEWGCVFDFNTPQSVYALGTATSNLSEQVLRGIEVAVKKYEREKSVERNNEHGQQSHVQRERGLSHSRPEANGTAPAHNGEIRSNEEKPPQKTQDHNLQHTASDREAVPAPDGDRTISQHSDGIANEPTTGKISTAQQSDITDGVGTAHGELENTSRGNNPGGTDLQLTQDGAIPAGGAVENAAPFSMAEMAGFHTDWNEFLKNAVVQTESVLNAALNSDKENTLIEIESTVKRAHFALSETFIESAAIKNKQPLIDELDKYFYRDRKPPLTEQLYDIVMRSDELGILRAAPDNSPAELTLETETTGRTIKTISESLAHTNIPLETVDALLRDGGNQNNSPLRMAAYFMKDKSLEDNADFLKREFKKGGKGFSINGQKVSAWFDGRGITIGEGSTAINAPDKVRLSWEQIAVRVRELLDTGQFLPQPELNKALDNERREIASRLWFFYRDDIRDLPQSWDSKQGHPEDVERIKYLLEQPEQLAEIVSNLEKDVDILRQSSPRRKIWSDPEQLLSDTRDCLLESIKFEAAEEIQSNGTQFITEDEIDTFLSEGSRVQDGKYRIFSYFLDEKSAKEKADFLKDEYGTGGGTHALSRADNSYEDHSSKGIKLSRGDIFGPYDTVELSWSNVAKRIETQIKEGRYMTRPELERIPSYEKEQLARDINSFFYNVPDEYARPYPQGAYFTDGKEKIRAMLEDTEQVAALIDMMKPIAEITPDGDTNYTIRQSAYSNILAYKDGEYNLFPNFPEDLLTESMIANRRPSDIPKESEPLPEPPPMFPSLEEQLATLAQAKQQEALSPVTIEQSDIDNAIVDWNGNLDSKIAVYEYMHENARARETANFLKDQYGNNLNAFTVAKGGAEAITLPWAKVQRRIAQLMDDNRFLTPAEQEKADNALKNTWNDLVAASTKPEVITVENLIQEALRTPTTEEHSNRAIAGMLLQDVRGARIDPIEFFNRTQSKSYDFHKAATIRGFLSRALDNDVRELAALPENERMPSPFPITNREWENADPSSKMESPGNKYLLLMRNNYADFLPVVIDDVKGHELQRYHFRNIDTEISGEVLAYSENEAARMLQHIENYTITAVEPIRETPVISDAEIDAMLLQAIENPATKEDVKRQFSENPRSREAAALLRTVYTRANYATSRTDGINGYMGLVGDNSGVTIAKGEPSSVPRAERKPPLSVTLNWIDVQKRLTNLAAEGRFAEVPAQTAPTAATPVLATMPITKPVLDTFSKADRIAYAKTADGFLFVTNGQYMIKTTEQDFNNLMTRVNNRKRVNKIEATENTRILDFVENAKGTFELTGQPYEAEDHYHNKSYVYADNKQYFQYKKDYVDVFEGNRLLVNDNASYDINSHHLVVRNSENELLGIVLPITVSDEDYERLANIIPLEIPRKSEIERIKENPTNDPYIGREFFDGTNNMIISGIQKINGEDKYVVPTIRNGVLSRSADLISVDKIEAAINRWESNRIYREQQEAEAEIKAQKEAEIRAEYEDTNGYTDNMPPMQKANALKALNESFYTKDYGRLNVKQFIFVAVQEGKTLEPHRYLKKKYAEMSDRGYIQELGWRAHGDVWPKYRAAVNDGVDSPGAEWLKEQHPFLHYALFRDESVLDNSYFNTEYRVMLDDRRFFNITKTAYDYGNYLINNNIIEQQRQDETLNIEKSDSDGITERFEIILTSDAYPEEDAYAIWDNEKEEYYTDSYGDMPTFDNEPDAENYLDTLRQTRNIETTEQVMSAAVASTVLTYKVGDIVYLEENRQFIIDEIRQYPVSGDQVKLIDLNMHIPIGRILDKADFERLLRDNSLNSRFFEHETPTPQSFDLSSYERYLTAKEKYPNHIVFSIASDFFELYQADAQFVADNFDYVIISQNVNGDKIPLVGIPDKSVDLLIEQLHEMGRDVAVVNSYGAIAEYPAAEHAAELDTPAPEQPRSNFRITDDHLGEGGTKTKYGYNVEAIRLLKTIESENRLATPEEQEILSRYVGWGGIPQAFDERNDGWKREYTELKELLTPDEYSMARASTLNAHYTSPTVIKAIYDTVERMGFKGGNVLEPACGIGNFFGLLPESMQGSKLYGVELDSISGRIAKQLYQKADITISGYEKTDKPDAFFDLTIGNVPFGDYKVADKRYDNHNFHIHDYFMAKALDQTRPGGIMAFVTSKYTLDKANPAVRKYLAQRAELLGAVRLPNDAFLKNAGTETTTDIIFMKKRDRLIDIEPEWVHLNQLTINDEGLTIPVNSYFVDNPQMILGTMGLDKRMNDKYGRDDVTACYSIPGADLAEQLKTALANIQGEISEPDLDDIGEAKDESIAADPTVKNFSYALVTPIEENGQRYAWKVGEGDVYYRENSRMYPVNLPTSTLERIKGMIALRECVNTLMEYQLNEYSDEAIAEKQAELNTLYDGFTSEFGLINSRGNSLAFSSDNSYYLLASLEILDENGNLERKADMFTKRTIKQNTVVTSVDTSSEALAVSIAERAKVDIDFMVELTGFSEEKIIKELEGVIFHDFGNPNRALPNFNPDIMKLRDKFPLVTADEYLSGNVREKLRKALDFNEAVGDVFQGVDTTVNIEALKTVQPKDLEASEIGVRLGSTWIHRDYIQQFVTELLKPPYPLFNLINVNYSEHTGEWSVDKRGRCPSSNVLACVTYGTGRMNAYEIIHDTLNLKDVRVFDYVKDDEGKDKRVLNKDETTKALQKQEQIKQAFKDWIWKDPERRHELVTLYNERFNNSRPREYDGSHLTMGGMTPNITLRTHQRDAIARVLYGGNTLLAHEVGAGKTFEMIGAAMESKRLGLCNKSLFAVPNHLTEQIASDFLRMYPSANILVAREKDFEPKNRKKFCAKIATGDYDAVILGHSQFEKIPISRERQIRHLNEQIDEITDGITDLMRNDEAHFSIKQLEKTRKNLEARLEKLLDPKRKDDVVTFEQLGIDRLFVDESHFYKNLFLYTKMRNVAGLSTAEAQKSSDMFMKCQYLDEITDNKGVIMATGTPLTNSMTEMYTLQRYLQYDVLQKSGLGHFDSWASTFGETVTALELAPEGKGYRARTRFARFHNLPELMDMFKNVADIKTADMIAAEDIPRPKANYRTIAVKPSEIQQEMVADLSDRAAKVHNRQVEPNIDNMLKITSDGRKIGLDQRLMNDMLPDDPGSKVNACMENVFNIWENTAPDRLTQVVFCDFSTPNADGRFNVYDDIKDKLLAKGVPKEEIAFIHDYNTRAQKKELFAKVRSGQVRVLFGSTFKLGTGTNIQDRIIAQHDLDCPWRPGDLEQRTGRSIRQGNLNPEVDIFRYVTESTFDAYLWQTVENKQKFISQIMTSKSPVRSCEDIDEAALSYAEIKALCAGDARIKQKMDLDIEVARLRLLKADHQSQRYRLEDNIIKYYPQSIEMAKEHIAGFKKDAECLKAHTPDDATVFPTMEIKGVVYDKKEEAGAALLETFKGVPSTTPVKIGTYRGFDMLLSFDTINKNFAMTLKGEMGYNTDLSRDVFGNISRLNNALADMPTRLRSVEAHLDNLYQQAENAKIELQKPFPYEDDLKEKSERLAKLDAELNIDGGRGGSDVIGGVDDEAAKQGRTKAAIPGEMSAKSKKPSILEGLRKNNKANERSAPENKVKSADICL